MFYKIAIDVNTLILIKYRRRAFDVQFAIGLITITHYVTNGKRYMWNSTQEVSNPLLFYVRISKQNYLEQLTLIHDLFL